MVKDIRSGSASSHISNLTNVNGILYFVADDGVHGSELWKSDGTSAGTIMVKDIRSGHASSSIAYLTKLNNNNIIFKANDGNSGSELWKSDGTSAGTTLVKDIVPGTGGSYPKRLTNIGNIVYFTLFNPSSVSYELYKSDGTNAGTVLLKSFSVTLYSNFFSLVKLENKLIFGIKKRNGKVEVWVSKGSSNNTVKIKEFDVRNIDFIGIVNNRLLISVQTSEKTSLWSTDGTVAGTKEIFSESF